MSVQHDLFDLGGELCMPGFVMIKDEYVTRLEDSLDAFNEPLPALKEFILPGGGHAASSLSSGPHGLPARRTTCLDSRTRSGHQPRDAEVPEPSVRSVVCHRACTGPPRNRPGSPLATQRIIMLQLRQ